MENNLIYRDFTVDLKKLLVGFLRKNNYQYYLRTEHVQNEVFLDELFDAKGALPLFMFDKQEILTQAAEELNDKLKPENPYFFIVEIILQPYNPAAPNTPAPLFGSICHVTHNIAKINGFKSDDQYYNNIITGVAKEILNQSSLIVQDKKIFLDELFFNYKNFIVDKIQKQNLQYDNLTPVK